MLSDEKQAVLGNMVAALEKLQSCPEFTHLIPEVRVNLVYALWDVHDRSGVAAVEGRITAVGGYPKATGLPVFGASDHMARLIIEARKYDPAVNAGINFSCDEILIQICRDYCNQRGWLFGWIDRHLEPDEVTRADGMSMPWKINSLVNRSGGMPRLFYEGEGWGKEPLFVATGKTAVEAVEIAVDIAGIYRDHSRNSG